MNTTLFVIGLVCVTAAVVGGGLKLAGAQFPPLKSTGRQLLLAIIGLTVVGASFLEGGQTNGASRTSPTPPPSPTEPATVLVAQPSPLPQTPASVPTPSPAPSLAAASLQDSACPAVAAPFWMQYPDFWYGPFDQYSIQWHQAGGFSVFHPIAGWQAYPDPAHQAPRSTWFRLLGSPFQVCIDPRQGTVLGQYAP
ncbi:MAG: hypothetical protein ACRDJ4_00155 [Actinomycetota bacterium]